VTPTAFDALADHVSRRVPASLGFSLYAGGEQSDFVRFTQGKVRQPGTVHQRSATLQVRDGRRHASAGVGWGGDPDVDRARLDQAVEQLLAMVPHLPEDPHLLVPSDAGSTAHHSPGDLPPAEDLTREIVAAASGSDLVGIYAGGRQWRAFADRSGQRDTWSAVGFLFDFSLVHDADRAVKCRLGGSRWDPEALRSTLAEARRTLTALRRPPRKVPPGRYRAWLEPAAVSELVSLMGRGGFSLRSHRAGTDCMTALYRGERALHPAVTLVEDTEGGQGPRFQSDGFRKPASVPLVVDGRYAQSLVSPRSEREFGVPHNGAVAHEAPRSLAMSPGTLPPEEALAALGTGVWVSDLWYLNFSDRNAARVTGMTRFATFWVEDGELVAPLEVMRFDASLFDLLGGDLEALGSRASFLPSASTYESRTPDSVRVPGLLVAGLPFTL
jgi:predicted Zn-dependent protease